MPSGNKLAVYHLVSNDVTDFHAEDKCLICNAVIRKNGHWFNRHYTDQKEWWRAMKLENGMVNCTDPLAPMIEVNEE